MKTVPAAGRRAMTRRQFSRRSALTSAGLAAISWSKVLGASERVLLGVLGPGNRGQSVLKRFLNNSDLEVVALCEIYDEHLRKTQSLLPRPAREFVDYQKLLELREVDAVLIATPDHWHAAMCIEAANAAKDIYVEKPLTYTLEEGKAIVRATRLNDRVVQTGMQQRSGAHYKKAKAEYFDTGKLGKVTLARTWWHGNSFHLRKAPFTDKPSGLDWKRFQGPRPWRDWDVQQFWNWRAYLDFGGGQITDLFTHWIDVVQWFMNEDLPKAAVASGGVYHYKDGRTAPDTIHVLLEYPGEWTATFEATLAPGIRGAGIEFVGTQGRLEITRGGYTFTPVEGSPVKESGDRSDGMTGDHVRNFLDCIKTRQRPNADVLAGHRSALASHLGNIAYLERRRIELDLVREEVRPG